VINKVGASGHATVVRLIENAEMSGAAVKIARRLNLSGVYGFDFMLEQRTGEAYLIEINPRSTQVGHLTLGLGRDIPAALYSAISERPVSPAEKVTNDDTIALFPQEWIRDPASTFLQSAYHDVPWDKPDLIRACVRIRRKQHAWYSQQSRLQEFSMARLPRT
jgi:ATP-grasp domain